MSAATRSYPATRPVFIPLNSTPWAERIEIGVQSRYIERGKQAEYIRTFHEAGESQHGITPILECSSGSDTIGASLSAFNLTFNTPSGRTISVECAYQGSKVFKGGGPFHDLYNTDSRSAKKDRRIRESGELLGFDFFGKKFGLVPQNHFYNWLYLSALVRRYPSISEYIGKPYAGFTDIWAMRKNGACQAESVAMAVGLERSGQYSPQFISESFIKSLSEVQHA